MKARVMMLSTALSGGGAEQVTRLLADRIPNTVCIVFENFREVDPTQFDLHVLPYRKTQGRSSKILFNIFRIIYIQGLKLRYRPDVTISHLEGPNFANQLTFMGGKRVIVVHNSLENNYCRVENRFGRLKLSLARYLYPRADRVVVVSEDILDELTQRFGLSRNKTRYIPNPIDADWINKKAKETFGDWRDELLQFTYLICLASLTRQKNHELLIRSFHSIAAVCPELKLFIIGEGDQEAKIRSLCRELGLGLYDHKSPTDHKKDARVFLLGFQANPYPFLLNARIFVLPSLWEGLPIAMLEAMTLRRPMIVSGCSRAIRDVFESKEVSYGGSTKEYRVPVKKPCGYLMPVFRDPQDSDARLAWAECMRGLLSDSLLRQEFGTEAKKLAEKFDIEQTASYWLDLISNLTGRR